MARGFWSGFFGFLGSFDCPASGEGLVLPESLHILMARMHLLTVFFVLRKCAFLGL